MRKTKHSPHVVLNAIAYVLRSGGQWRMLPSDFPNWSSVYYYFNKWSQAGIFEFLNLIAVQKARVKAGRSAEPSMVIIDSQSVKSTAFVYEDIGCDGGKKIKGRKRHIVVDTFGFLIAGCVHAANIHDGKGLDSVCKKLKESMLSPVVILADSGYQGEKNAKTASKYGYTLQIVKRSQEGFQVVRQRWKVERTFAWFSHDKRMLREFEHSATNSEAFMFFAAARHALKTLN